MDDAKWEGLCKRCGKCCYLRLLALKEKKVLETGIRCQYLMEDNLCRVYNNRPDWCSSAEEMLKNNILPDECGYKKGG